MKILKIDVAIENFEIFDNIKNSKFYELFFKNFDNSSKKIQKIIDFLLEIDFFLKFNIFAKVP